MYAEKIFEDAESPESLRFGNEIGFDNVTSENFS
jgi:hypothetical protein